MITFKSNIDKAIKLLEKMKAEYAKAAENITLDMATDYRAVLFSAILSGRFAGGYSSYSPAYALRKMAKVGHLKYWIYRGDLIKSLSVFKSTTGIGWGAGITPGARNSEGKLIEMYAGVNEELRPIFSSAFVQFVRDKVPFHLERTGKLLAASWRL